MEKTQTHRTAEMWDRGIFLKVGCGCLSGYNMDGVSDMVFNATFNNISVISWLSVLLIEETVVSGENPRPAASH
jgi:hypothetical protein